MSFKTFVFGHPKDKILKEIEEYGKSILPKTELSLYKESEKGKAKYYSQNLEATRKAYKKIKDGCDVYNSVNELYLYVKDNKIKNILEKCRRN